MRRLLGNVVAWVAVALAVSLLVLIGWVLVSRVTFAEDATTTTWTVPETLDSTTTTATTTATLSTTPQWFSNLTPDELLLWQDTNCAVVGDLMAEGLEGQALTDAYLLLVTTGAPPATAESHARVLQEWALFFMLIVQCDDEAVTTEITTMALWLLDADNALGWVKANMRPTGGGPPPAEK
jgi:hypothetical protein